MDRSNFYFEQEVTQAELDQAFDDVEAVAKQQVTDHSDPGGDFATWGVVVGLVVAEQGTPDLTVQVSDGVAYDENGERIPHANGPTSLDLTSLVPGSDSRYVRVYVEHDTVESDPRVDGAAVPLNYRIADSFAFSLDAGAIAASPVKPTITAGKVLLATILLTSGQTQILDADISLSLGNTYTPGNDEIDRQEGGVVAHGRLLTRAIGFEYEVNGPPKICMGRNELNMEQGDLLMDYFSQAPATQGGGGRIFMEDGRIYKTRLIRAGGPPEDSADNGYRYYEYNVGTDEFGDSGLTIEKWASWSMEQMFPYQAGTDQQSPWGPHTTPAYNCWLVDTIGPLPVNAYDSDWIFVSDQVVVSTWYHQGLAVPLTGLPYKCRLISVEFGIDVTSIVANVTFGVGVYRKQGNTVTLMNDADAITFTAMPGTGFQWFSTDVLETSPDYRLLDQQNYAYYAVLIPKLGATTSAQNLGVKVKQARAEYHIREASGLY